MAMIEVVRVGDRDLVAREDRHAAPGRDAVAADVEGLRDQSALVELAAERGDRARVGEQHLGAAPPAEQFVQVVRAGDAVVGLEPLVVLAVVEQPELAVVDELVLLALLQRLDGEPSCCSVWFIGWL
jgi:hypothetical protein